MLNLIVNIPNLAVILFGGGITWWFYKEYKKTKSRALLNSLPGVFTSLGLLGTFWSICTSLYNIGSKVNVGPVIDNTGKTLREVAVTSNQNLDIIEIISKLIPAFTSSILGLICALGVTVFAKWIFAKEEQQENERMHNRTPEDYIKEIADNSHKLSSINSLLKDVEKQQKQLIKLQEQQDDKYKEYNDNLNSNIKHQNEILKEFIDGFVNRMDDIFTQMHGAIEQQVKNFGEEQFSKTSHILSTITQDLSNVTSEIINQQKTSVESMMAKTNNDISGISTTITTVLETLTTSLSGSLENMGNQQNERLSSIISNYDSLATKLTEQNTSFVENINAKFSDEFAKVQQHNADSLKQMTEMQDTYKQLSSDLLANAMTMNEKSVSDLRESLGTFVENIQSSLSAQCDTLGKSIGENVESLNKAYAFIESLVAEIKQNYDQAVLAYGDAVNVAHRTNENSEKAITATSKSLESVAETNQMIKSVLDILTERQENIENLTKQIGSMSSTIESMQRLESTLNKIANK